MLRTNIPSYAERERRMYTEKARWMAEHRTTIDEYMRKQFETDRQDVLRRLGEVLRNIDNLQGRHKRIIDIEHEYKTFTGPDLTDLILVRKRLPREYWDIFDDNVDEMKRISDRITFMKSIEYFDGVSDDAKASVKLDEAFIAKYLGGCVTR